MSIVTFAIIIVAWLAGGGVYFLIARNQGGPWLAFMLGGITASAIIALAPTAIG